MISRAPFRAAAAALLALCTLSAIDARAQSGDPSSDLVGLWKAKRRFGPDARGPLLIVRSAAGYTADMLGFTIPVTASGGELWFDLPNHQGRFRGKSHAGGAIRGFWFPGAPGTFGSATNVTLSPIGPNRWSGQVAPLDDEVTFFLLVTRRPDGSLAAVLRNLERDWGGLLRVSGITRSGNSIALLARRGAQGRDTTVVSGTIDTAREVITLDFANGGGSYDFTREDDPLSAFYPRGRAPGRYVYREPPALDDGWPTASVEDVGIDRAAIERAVQQVVEMSMDSINAPQVHAVLVVRHGRLVLEEYFHGDHRDLLHNERSASKSVSATIIAAAMLQGAPLRLSTPVYQVMNGGAFPAGLEPRKRAMTLEHLMTMSSGYYCDDNDDNAPGNENGMWEQEKEPDFYRFTLPLPLAFAPGEKAIYCSINPNLALGVAGRAAGESPFWLFQRLVADPMEIRRYGWAADRAGNPYGGGGMDFRARDFIKFGQMMLDGGAWHGHGIVGRDFVARATSPLVHIGDREYGLLWWPQQYPYHGRTLRGFAALGNGGQIVMAFPELDLVVATNGGSYGSRGWRYAGAELIPNILAAVRGSPARSAVASARRRTGG